VRLFAELRRRNVFRVAAAYSVTAWLLAQVTDLVLDNFGAPDSVMKYVLIALFLGFPLSIVFAWVFELTPEGIRKEKDVDRTASITRETGRKLNYLIIAVLVVAVGILLFERVTIDVDDTDEVTATAAGRISIAVLPFDNRSNREDDEFFTDGIHDDLVTTIANIGSMKVISRTSVMEYRDTTKKIPEIARELGVRTILEGGVQRAGNQVRINVQLIDAENDEHLWAEIYDRELTVENLFRIQSEVTNAIAKALQATLSPDEQRRVARVPTDNLEAYETYLLGRQKWTTRTAESTAEAVELFRKAVEIDPQFAEAWAGLGDAYRHQVPYGGVSASEAFRKAERAVRRALELNGELAEAHAALGGLLLQKYRVDEAAAELERAIELNPNYSPAYNLIGLVLYRQGKFEQMRAIYLKGLEVDPLSAVLMSNLAAAFTALGDFEASRSQYERIVELYPESPSGYRRLGFFETTANGRIDAAMPWQFRGILADPDDVEGRARLAMDLLDVGDTDAARAWLDSALALRPENGLARLGEVLLALHAGDEATATGLAIAVDADEPDEAWGETFVFLASRQDIVDGNHQKAWDRYRKFYPSLLADDGRPVAPRAANAGLSLVQLLRGTDATPEAERLLRRVTATLENRPVMGAWGSGGALPAAYALAGRKSDALEALETAVDAGWRYRWWYTLEQRDWFDSVRDDPRFEALLERIRADMAQQRETSGAWRRAANSRSCPACRR